MMTGLHMYFLRTLIGRGRAWLRISLMRKELADHFKMFTENKLIMRFVVINPLVHAPDSYISCYSFIRSVTHHTEKYIHFYTPTKAQTRLLHQNLVIDFWILLKRLRS